MTVSSVVVTKPFSVTPSMLMMSVSVRAQRLHAAQELLPLQSSALPLIDEADNENPKEDHHRHEAEQADLTQHHGPGKQERDLQIEQDEQDRHQVVAHIEFHA